jgi:hypothetical protein
MKKKHGWQMKRDRGKKEKNRKEFSGNSRKGSEKRKRGLELRLKKMPQLRLKRSVNVLNKLEEKKKYGLLRKRKLCV